MLEDVRSICDDHWRLYDRILKDTIIKCIAAVVPNLLSTCICKSSEEFGH